MSSSYFSYFFLFFGLPPIFSYFFMKFLVFPIFLGFLPGTQKHFEIFEIKLSIKLIPSTKKLKLQVKKDQFEAFMSNFSSETHAQTFSVLLIACKGFWEVHLHACASAMLKWGGKLFNPIPSSLF